MVGLVALAGVLTTTLPGVAGTIASAAQSMICKASGSSCPSSSANNNGGNPRAGAPPGFDRDANAPDDGPPIGNGQPIFSVPGLGEGQGVSANDDSLGPKITVERTNSPCTIDGSGKASVTLGASIDFNVSAGAGARGKGVTVEVAGSLGQKTSYEVQTDPTTGRQIEQGQRRAPNPADPKSIPMGSSITLNRESYRGANGKVAYRNVAAELGYKEGHKVSSAVQRVDAGHVRVTVGDSDLVENTVGVSVDRAGIKWGQSFEDGKARAVDLDISTPEGRAAYGTFIETGHLPKAGDAGASNPTTSVSTTDTSTGQAYIDLGRVGLTAGGPSVGYQNIETTHADGSRERNVFVRSIDTVMSTHYDLDGAGNITGESWALHLQDVDPQSIQGFQDFTGRHGAVNGPRDVSLTFGPNDVSALQNAALDQLLASQRGRGGPFGDGGTRAQMLAYLRAHDDGTGLMGTAQEIVPLLGIAGAKVPDDVLRAFLSQAHGSAEGLLDALSMFAQATRVARHKLGTNPVEQLPMGYSNRPVGC
jgi:hypothetical protein